jgi:hypothetical protein
MSESGDVKERKRVPDVDFWRGFALVVILIDHVPHNILDLLTPQNFGFSDAAEGFIFLSGVSVSLAYSPMFRRAGFGWLVGRCARRAIKLYFVHIALAVGTVAIALGAAKLAGDNAVATRQGLDPFLDSPFSALLGIATLTYHPNYSNILPIYVIFMLWAAVVLPLASRNPTLALLVSFAIYAVGRRHGEVQYDHWFFNPLRWQLVFSIGVVCGLTWRQGLPRPQRLLVLLASAVVLGAAILSVKAVGLNSVARTHLDLDKPELGSARLLHFVALAYLISAATVAQRWAERMGRIVSGQIGRSVQGIGRNGLLFFAFGAVSSAGGRSLMIAATTSGTSRLFVHFIGLAYTMAAVAGMFALLHRLDRTRKPLPEALSDGKTLNMLRAGVCSDTPSQIDRDGVAILPGGERAAPQSTGPQT